MGQRRTAVTPRGASDRQLRLRRARPRSFAEWSALRRWGKLPQWEKNVAGYLLRQARTDAALSQRELAERLGITQQAVSRAEQWSSNPTVDLMRRWLDACGARLELRVAR
ncbi:MAG: helix-turn-helix domain-containing protein [Acidobacteria bacterium]|nr:helix-turn-helix domain-containing protein [Acidobacteriota bacterium]